MASHNGTQEAKIASGSEPNVNFVGGRVRVFNEQVTYASQASGDTIKVATLPAGAVILGFILNTDTSTSTATLAVGDGTTAAKYAAASAYTTTDAPQLIGKAATALSALSAQTDIVLTIGTAALPSSGNLSFQTVYVVD